MARVRVLLKTEEGVQPRLNRQPSLEKKIQMNKRETWTLMGRFSGECGWTIQPFRVAKKTWDSTFISKPE